MYSERRACAFIRLLPGRKRSRHGETKTVHNTTFGKHSPGRPELPGDTYTKPWVTSARGSCIPTMFHTYSHMHQGTESIVVLVTSHRLSANLGMALEPGRSRHLIPQTCQKRKQTLQCDNYTHRAEASKDISQAICFEHEDTTFATDRIGRRRPGCCGTIAILEFCRTAPAPKDDPISNTMRCTCATKCALRLHLLAHFPCADLPRNQAGS